MSWRPASETTPQARAHNLGAMLNRLVRAAGFAAFRLVPGDDERLLSCLHWLQHYSIEEKVVLQHEPLFVLSGMDNWLRRARSLRLSTLIAAAERVAPRPVYLVARALGQALYPFYWVARAVWRAAGVGVGAASELEQAALRWIPDWAKPIPRSRLIPGMAITPIPRLPAAPEPPAPIPSIPQTPGTPQAPQTPRPTRTSRRVRRERKR